MDYLDIEIEGIEVRAYYYFDGKDLPATLTDQAEHRDLVIRSVELKGEDISDIIKDELWDHITEICRDEG